VTAHHSWKIVESHRGQPDLDEQTLACHNIDPCLAASPGSGWQVPHESAGLRQVTFRSSIEVREHAKEACPTREQRSLLDTLRLLNCLGPERLRRRLTERGFRDHRWSERWLGWSGAWYWSFLLIGIQMSDLSSSINIRHVLPVVVSSRMLSEPLSFIVAWINSRLQCEAAIRLMDRVYAAD
jgi:hypothetical protein